MTTTVTVKGSNGSVIWPVLVWGTKIVGLLFVCIVGLVYYNQDKLLYIPNPPGFPKTPDENPPGFNSPGDWTKEGRLIRKKGPSGTHTDPIPFEDQIITTDDGASIHTWLLVQDDNDEKHHPVLIYFHGNAGNMGFRLKNAADMFGKVKINVLMMDYRGYGKSKGTPTEKGLKADADAVLKYAISHPKLQGCPIIVFGRSLGGAVSFYLAQKFPSLVNGIIVENTFLSISAMVDILMPFLKPLKSFLLTLHWGSEEFIDQLSQPMFFISGDSDTLVPPSHMKRLYDLAKKASHRDFYSVLGGGHNDSWEVSGEEYYLRMKQFIDKYIRQGTVEEKHSRAKFLSANPKSNEEIAPAEVRSISEEDNEYEMVDEENTEGVAIPTMNQHFQVK